MRFILGRKALASFCIVWIGYLSLASCAPFGFSQDDGQTRLLGSSFGIPGVSRTYDYVVRNIATALPFLSPLTEPRLLEVAPLASQLRSD